MAEMDTQNPQLNSTVAQLPPNIADLVGDIEPISRWDIGTEAVENVAKIAGVQDKRVKLHSVLGIWSEYYRHERKLRKSVAQKVFVALFIEIGCSIAVMACIGFGWMHFNKWVANIFFTTVFGQVSAMAYWIIKSLFPAPKTDPLSQINDIVSKL